MVYRSKQSQEQQAYTRNINKQQHQQERKEERKQNIEIWRKVNVTVRILVLCKIKWGFLIRPSYLTYSDQVAVRDLRVLYSFLSIDLILGIKSDATY
jgi:hypothetical protein